jgi:hypothetical protein
MRPDGGRPVPMVSSPVLIQASFPAHGAEKPLPVILQARNQLSDQPTQFNSRSMLAEGVTFRRGRRTGGPQAIQY